MLLVRAGIVASLVLMPRSVRAQVVQARDIPNPRPTGWTVDLTGRISESARSTIDRLGDEVSSELGAEIAVVVVGSIGGDDPRRFATSLFNTWGIGDPDRDNGVLIFVALDDRAAELILGDGIDNTPQLAIADEIMQKEMVPRLRRGDPSSAVVVGATESVNRLLRPLVSATNASPSADSVLEVERAPSGSAQRRLVDDEESGRGSRLPVYGGLAALFAALGVGGRKYIRYRSRNCSYCGTPCTRLSEAADDEYLDDGERAEERVGSVDYDVWACPGCGQVEKFRYGAVFTRYSRCPSCGAKTRNKLTTTLRSATYQRGGLVEVTERCAHCTYENRYTRTTPRLTRSSSGSSGSSGFSGGSSSGGGSSGRW